MPSADLITVDSTARGNPLLFRYKT